MIFNFNIPTPNGPFSFAVEPGSSLLFVGANGGGKTRLAVKIETDLQLKAHRISAHRALTLNPSVTKISAKSAQMGLKVGVGSETAALYHRQGSRWQQRAAISLLNDYDFLVQALFAEQTNSALTTHKNLRAGLAEAVLATKLEKLAEIWDRILPHRKLEITGDDIQLAIPGSDIRYSASEMSDGERAVFYLIGQVLMAEPESLIIFDEPELHIHRSIMTWRDAAKTTRMTNRLPRAGGRGRQAPPDLPPLTV
jgi:ABC-type glutathione transport system ATPase component